MVNDPWEAKRKKAAWRRRRIIFNNDGGDKIGHVVDRAGGITGPDSAAKPGTREWFWAQRCTGLEDSQVDSIFYCTGDSIMELSEDAKAADAAKRGDPLDKFGLTFSVYGKTLIEKGLDSLQLIIDFARRSGKEVFWTQRLNDIHDNWTPSSLPQYKKDHPAWLLFQPEDIGKGRIGLMEPHMNATAVDYGRPEIRDREFAIIEHVCRRYDVDGIELDFMRQPIYFRPTLEGRPVELPHLEMMTEFIRRIRRMTEEVGLRRDRPLLISCRVPCRAGICREIGLDIEKWLNDSLIDIVVASIEFEPFTGPISELVKLGHQHDVPVYADISQNFSLNWEALNFVEGWIGAAMNAWNAGVDGIYTFNLFDINSPVYRIVGEPVMMETRDKVYAVDNIAGRYRTWEHVLPPAGRLPLELPLGKKNSVVLPVGDDVADQAKKGKLDSFHLRIYLKNFTHSDRVECKLNGHVVETELVYSTEGISPVVCGTFFLRSMPAPTCVKKGDNLFEICLKKRCDSAPGWPSLIALQMPIRYKVCSNA